MKASAVEYRGATVKAPNGSTILDHISLEIEIGQRIAFLGRSGAGKTTALKVINGLVPLSSGEILVEGHGIEASLIDTRRRIGYVMQRPALFPHRTVSDNVATVPRLLEWPEERIAAEAEELLGRLELPVAEFGGRFPHMLSGGQQQRVAIARALIASPSILLCDEPFSALDPLIRVDLQDLLLQLADDRPEATMVFVTHDVREAMRVAERIVLFDNGNLVADTPSEMFPSVDLPLARRFVATALGERSA